MLLWWYDHLWNIVFGATFLMEEKCYTQLQEEQGGSGVLQVAG